VKVASREREFRAVGEKVGLLKICFSSLVSAQLLVLSQEVIFFFFFS
jgi:hypothetical protein